MLPIQPPEYPTPAVPYQPVPTQATWAIIRFDLAHIQGILEGTFLEGIVASKLRDAYQRKAEEPDSKFHALHATFHLFQRVDEPPEAGQSEDT